MGFKLTPEQVAAEIVRRGVAPFWADRIREMVDHGTTSHGHPHQDRKVSPVVRVAWVPKSWPLRGSITLEREDGATLKLRQTKARGFEVILETAL